MANIKRMFHQVFVVPQDRGEFCYLWWPSGELSRKPKTYQMLVHIFGAKSSRVWLDMPLEKRPPEVVEAVFRDFYPDDLLKSFSTEEHAINIRRK